MNKNEALFNLVKSLTKTEKRFFTLRCKPEGTMQYYALFKLIEKTVAGANEVKKEFKSLYPTGIYDAASKHLYTILIRSLCEYEHHKTAENELLTGISEIRVLFKKGIYEHGFHKIQALKKLARQHELNLYYALLYKLELEYNTRIDRIHDTEQELITNYKNCENALANEIHLHRLNHLYHMIAYRYNRYGSVTDAKGLERLNDLSLEENRIIQSNKEQVNSYSTKKTHLMFQSVWFQMAGNRLQSLKEQRYLFELAVVSNFNREDPEYLLYLINSYLFNLQLAGQWEEQDMVLQKIAEVSFEDSYSQFFLKYLMYKYRFIKTIKLKNFANALELKKAFENENKHKKFNLPANEESFHAFLLSIAYFKTGHLDKSLECLYDVHFHKSDYTSKSLTVTIRLFYIMLHTCKRSYDFLPYEIKSFERYLKKQNTEYKFESETLTFIKNYIKLYASDKKHRLKQSFLENIQQLPEIKKGTYSSFVDLEYWIKNI